MKKKVLVNLIHFSIIPKDDPKQALRIRRFFMAVATMIDKTLRNTEFCGRYGGEEFLIVLTQTDSKGALIFAERMRTNIENALFPDLGPHFKVTVSIGLTEYQIGEDIDKIIFRVDEALYLAKKGGRKRVESA